jgi:hypothetical protein
LRRLRVAAAAAIQAATLAVARLRGTPSRLDRHSGSWVRVSFGQPYVAVRRYSDVGMDGWIGSDLLRANLSANAKATIYSSNPPTAPT